MKLWKLMFRHYSLKDSEEGILCYLLANSSEQIYMYLRDNTNIEDGSEYGIRICTMWKYKEDPNEPDYDPKYKERIIACCGEMFDEMEQVDDQYYGVTHYGWKCVCEGINLKQAELLKRLGIPVVDITKSKLENTLLNEKEKVIIIPDKDVYESIGDKVFFIFDGEITECLNCGVYLDADGELYFTLSGDERIFPYKEPNPDYDSDPTDWSSEFISIPVKEWNKTVFLSFEEAEAKLKSMSKKE